MRSHAVITVVLTLFLTLRLLITNSAFACGPFVLETVFVHTVHPDFPLAHFASGRLGMVQPTYARSYLYVAYRYLEGAPFTPDEQKALTELWKDRLETGWSPGVQPNCSRSFQSEVNCFCSSAVKLEPER